MAAEKKSKLRTNEHWMNVNVIVLQMKIDFWIVGTLSSRLRSVPAPAPYLSLSLSLSLSLYRN